jgi:hypothetical protein
MFLRQVLIKHAREEQTELPEDDSSVSELPSLNYWVTVTRVQGHAGSDHTSNHRYFDCKFTSQKQQEQSFAVVHNLFDGYTED